MTEKRFLYELHKGCFRDNGVEMSIKDVLDTLNEQHKEIKQLRNVNAQLVELLSDIGLKTDTALKLLYGK